MAVQVCRYYRDGETVTATQQRAVESLARRLREHLVWEEHHEYIPDWSDHEANRAERVHLAFQIRPVLYFLTRRSDWAWK